MHLVHEPVSTDATLLKSKHGRQPPSKTSSPARAAGEYVTRPVKPSAQTMPSHVVVSVVVVTRLPAAPHFMAGANL